MPVPLMKGCMCTKVSHAMISIPRLPARTPLIPSCRSNPQYMDKSMDCF